MSRWRAILFDFDYTLADSSPGIIVCANAALAQLGLPPSEADCIRATIGLPLAETFVLLTGLHDHELQAAFVRLFIQHADKVMVDSTTLYDATRVVIPGLAHQGLRLGVVSTKFRSRLKGVLEREGLLAYFSVLVGGDNVPIQKPAPDGLLLAASLLALDVTNCLYVGDNPVDAQAARQAGMDFVGLLSGPAAAAAFDQEEQLVLLPDLPALPGWLEANVSGHSGAKS
ncbi:MAG: HAD family hydrolase [Anaerolineae bacterium]